MPRKLNILAALVVLAVLAAGILIGHKMTEHVLYPATMIVDAIEDDIVYLSTETGHQYAYIGASDEEPGELMSVLMDSMGTRYVTDDRIVQVRYSGF
jgi:hypothetical protein